VEKLLQV